MKRKELEYIYLDTLIQKFLAYKKRGFALPSGEERETIQKEIHDISREISRIKKEEIDMPSCNQEKVHRTKEGEMLEQIKKITEKEIILKKARNFLKRTSIHRDTEMVPGQMEVTFIEAKRPTVQNIILPPVPPILDSIITTSAVVKGIKEESTKEVHKAWKYDNTISFLIEEIVAQRTAKENSDINRTLHLFRFACFALQNRYYRKIRGEMREESTGAGAYQRNLMLALLVYPNMKGYVDALKIIKKLEQKDGNRTPIVKEIEKVLLHEQTTEQMVKKLNIDDLNSRQIVKERWRSLK